MVMGECDALDLLHLFNSVPVMVHIQRVQQPGPSMASQRSALKHVTAQASDQRISIIGCLVNWCQGSQ